MAPDDALILNVDDDEAGLYAKTRALRAGGLRVIEATTGGDALRIADAERPALILLDVKLPDISGLEVCRIVKRDFPEVLVLQISASFVAGDDRVRGFESGADSYLTQPVAPNELVASVRALLRVRAAEQRLRELNETLEQRVAERTAELVGRQYAASARDRRPRRCGGGSAAGAEDGAIGQLTGGVAHDFNNLLTVIRSSADLLRRRELPEDKRRRYVDAISDTADRAARLTGQLLAFARRQALKPEVFDAGDRVRGVAEMLKTVLGSRIKLSIDIRCADCFIEADAGQFETALVNMAVNARDAMDGEGELRLGIDLAAAVPALRGHAASAGDFVAISVADTGHASRPTTCAASSSRSSPPRMSARAPPRLEPGLWFRQAVGGATSTFKARAAKARSSRCTCRAAMCAHAAASAERNHGQGAVGQGHVLVVEDNADVGEFAKQLLEDLGYQATLVPNSAAALDLLDKRADDFDLVFSDVVMPGMSGVELGQTIRRRFPDLKIILTSGYSHVLAGDANHGFELLHKPYSVESLSRVLRGIRVRARN
jgi:DNA-binding response OmpR family regulator